MKNLKKLTISIIALVSINVLAFNVLPQLQDDRTRLSVRRQRTGTDDRQAGKRDRDRDRGKAAGADTAKTAPTGLSALVIEDDSIPDSLLHPRWKVQRTVPITADDARKRTADLSMPDNIKQEVVYNDTLNRYFLGSKLGGGYLSTPLMMTPPEYKKWSERQEMNAFFRNKNDEIVKEKGKEKFSFSDMHFDLGPAEKIFGPGGVRIKTQGTAELKLGATMKEIDNPSLPIRNRKTTMMNFDEKINLNVNGKVYLLVEVHRRCLAVADRERRVVDFFHRGSELQLCRSLCLDAHAAGTEDLLCRSETEMHVGE